MQQQQQEAGGGLKLLVCYGSQTGNAEFLAKRLHALVDKELPHLHPQLQCMKDYTKFALPEFDLAVFVLSSTGEGEPPDNARSFWRFLVRKTHPKDLMARLKFTILGLGDTNYETYQQMPRRLEERLLELGAACFYKRGEADDATGLEDVVEPWIGDLMPALKAAINSSQSTAAVKADDDATDAQPSSTTPANDVAQAMYGLSLDAASSPAAAATPAAATTAAPVKKKIIIRRAPQKEVPDLAPCPYTLAWAEQTTTTAPAYAPAIPASMPAASPLLSAELVGARYLSTTDAVKPVLEVELRVPSDSGLKWVPGDAFALLCPNPTHEVTQVINRLGLDGKQVFSLHPVSASSPLPQHIRFPCTVRTALTHYVDLHAVPKKSSLRTFAEHASDPKDRERLLFLSSVKGADDYRREVLEEGATLLDLLIDYPSLLPPLEEVIDKLPPQQPRYYSHVTSPLASASTIRFAFSLVRWKSPVKGRPRRGLGTDWLYRLSVGRGFIAPLDDNAEEEAAALAQETDAETKAREHEGFEFDTRHVPVFARPTRDFVVPEPGANTIMVGAGTGVSPFLGFIQHRELLAAKAEDKAKSDWWLFFGCRNENKDFLYRAELEGSVERGVLHKLTAAFSRDSEEVVYVQHRMVEHGADIADRLLNANASIYVCGDGAGVVKGVNAAVVEILQKFAGLEPTAAKDYHASLLKDRRLLFDVW